MHKIPFWTRVKWFFRGRPWSTYTIEELVQLKKNTLKSAGELCSSGNLESCSFGAGMYREAEGIQSLIDARMKPHGLVKYD